MRLDLMHLELSRRKVQFVASLQVRNQAFLEIGILDFAQSCIQILATTVIHHVRILLVLLIVAFVFVLDFLPLCSSGFVGDQIVHRVHDR